MTTIVYTTSTCPFCKMLIDFLKENNIELEEKRVDSDNEAKKDMLEKSGGFLGVPFTVVLKEGEEVQTIIGFDKNRLKQVYGI